MDGIMMIKFEIHRKAQFMKYLFMEFIIIIMIDCFLRANENIPGD